MRKLYLIFHGRFPSEKAAALFTAKNAESFSRAGVDVEVIVPKRQGIQAQTAHDYFGVERIFKISALPAIDLFDFNLFGLRCPRKIAFYISFISFSGSCFFFIRRQAKFSDIIYSNESLPLFLASFVHKNNFYEMHDFPESKLFLFGVFLKRMRWVLVHNRWKMNRLHEVFKVSADKIIHEPNAVDVGEFDIAVNKDETRRNLALPLDKKIVMYTGHLYGWKGVDTLAKAATNLPAEYLVVFVGGTEKDIKSFKEKYGDDPHILIAGYKKHSEIPLWQKAADVLVLPNTAKENISKYYTSPMKLFEYAASSRPIVASRIPSIAELVDEQTVFLVEPDDAVALADGIRRVCENETMALSLVNAAYVWVGEHTWTKRAKRILRFADVLI